MDPPMLTLFAVWFLQPANSIFLSHHSSTSHQHQYNEESTGGIVMERAEFSSKRKMEKKRGVKQMSIFVIQYGGSANKPN